MSIIGRNSKSSTVSFDFSFPQPKIPKKKHEERSAKRSDSAGHDGNADFFQCVPNAVKARGVHGHVVSFREVHDVVHCQTHHQTQVESLQ